MSDEEPVNPFAFEKNCHLASGTASESDGHPGFPAVEEHAGVAAAGDEGMAPDSIEAVPEGNCVHIRWLVSCPKEKDELRVFVHNRSHIRNYLTLEYTRGRTYGEFTVKALQRGYYDVRYIENGAAESKDIKMCVFCIGRPVEMTVERINRGTIEVTLPPECADSDNWIALFKESELGNRRHSCLEYKCLRDAETAVPVPRLHLRAPVTPGNYNVRFFYKDSMEIGAFLTGTSKSHAYSGIKTITIPVEDTMVGHFDSTTMQFSVAWKLYSTRMYGRNWLGVKEAWIGLFSSSDPAAERITYEYLASHTHEVKTEGGREFDEGTVTLVTPDKMKAYAATHNGALLPEARNWELRFVNSNLGTPEFVCPCFPPERQTRTPSPAASE